MRQSLIISFLINYLIITVIFIPLGMMVEEGKFDLPFDISFCPSTSTSASTSNTDSHSDSLDNSESISGKISVLMIAFIIAND